MQDAFVHEGVHSGSRLGNLCNILQDFLLVRSSWARGLSKTIEDVLQRYTLEDALKRHSWTHLLDTFFGHGAKAFLRESIAKSRYNKKLLVGTALSNKPSCVSSLF